MLRRSFLPFSRRKWRQPINAAITQKEDSYRIYFKIICSYRYHQGKINALGSYLWHYMEVSGHLQDPVVITAGTR